MHTRHMNELMLRLERVADVGVAEIRRNELMKWFDKDRLTIGAWSEVNEKWTEVLVTEGYTETEIKEIPLFVGESDGVFVFVYGARLDFDSEYQGGEVDPWLLPISEWMTTKERKPRVAKEDQASYHDLVIKQDVNGTITVEEDGIIVSPTRPRLQEIAGEIGVSVYNSKDKLRNTRQLGAEVISALKARDTKDN